jgi:hypothetical protein
MLFNTDATIDILKVVNTAFNRDNLRRLRHDTAFPWTTAFSQLPNPAGFGGAVGTYNTVAKALGIDLDGGAGLRSRNWQAWLDQIDNKTQSVAGIQTTVSTVIGQAISDAINNNGQSYRQIEFFAVPAQTDPAHPTQPVVTAFRQDFKDKTENIQW